MKRLVTGSFFLLLTACATTIQKQPAPFPAPDASSAPPPAAAATWSNAELFVSAAKSMLGQPYRYGGAAPGGFDCSGLVFYAAAGAGLHLPRTAHAQLRMGSTIGRRDLKAGDLVFMRLHSKELHVGIALDGGRFVHAPAAGGHVRIDSLDAAPYANGFLEARRIADDHPRFAP